MTIENAGASTVDNAPNSTVSGLPNLDLSNPFVVGDLLEKSGAIEPEKTPDNIDNDNQDKTPPAAVNDTQNPPNADEQNKKDEPPALSAEDAERFLSADPTLQRIKELESLGYSKEEARRVALGLQEQTPNTQEIPEENYKIVDVQNNPQYKPYLELTPEDIQEVKRLASNPTEQDLIRYLNRQEMAAAKQQGRQPNQITEIPELEDPALNTVFQMQLKNNVKAEYANHLRNLNDALSIKENNVKVEQDFNSRLSNKLIKEFPALGADGEEATIVANYFQDLFSKKANALDPAKRANLKELEKVFDKALTEFKPLFEPLCKHLGVSFGEQQKPQGDAAKLAQFQMQQMSNVNNNQPPAGGATQVNIKNIDASNPVEVGKALMQLGIIPS